MEIKKIERTDWKYSDNDIIIRYEGKVDFNSMIPELVELFKKYEEK